MGTRTCQSSTGDRRTAPTTTALKKRSWPDWRGSACAAIVASSTIIRLPHSLPSAQVLNSANAGGWLFAADPNRSFIEQTVFWAPEALPTVVPVRPALLVGPHSEVSLD